MWWHQHNLCFRHPIEEDYSSGDLDKKVNSYLLWVEFYVFKASEEEPQTIKYNKYHLYVFNLFLKRCPFGFWNEMCTFWVLSDFCLLFIYADGPSPVKLCLCQCLLPFPLEHIFPCSSVTPLSNSMLWFFVEDLSSFHNICFPNHFSPFWLGKAGLGYFLLNLWALACETQSKYPENS